MGYGKIIRKAVCFVFAAGLLVAGLSGLYVYFSGALAGAVGRRVATKRTGNNADAVRALVRGQNPKKERLTVQRAKTALEKAIGNPLLLKESAVAASGQ